jgi:hypothetical protein
MNISFGDIRHYIYFTSFNKPKPKRLRPLFVSRKNLQNSDGDRQSGDQTNRSGGGSGATDGGHGTSRTSHGSSRTGHGSTSRGAGHRCGADANSRVGTDVSAVEIAVGLGTSQGHTNVVQSALQGVATGSTEDTSGGIASTRAQT